MATDYKFIFIRQTFQGAWVIHDDNHQVQYILYTKKERLKDFKAKFGYRYKHNVVVIEE